jgi:parallel beta helix pectate lyase-like protein
MRKIALALAILGTTLTTALYTAPAHAQASRTWVSGVGDDANPCSRTAPCKTFAGAISKTAAGGEIDALDPAGYGAVTITKAITIDGGGGQVASVLVSGTNGIVVQAGPSDQIILRNLRINGIGTGINGIRFLAGRALTVDNCDIFGFTTNGVDVALGATAVAEVRNSTFRNNNGFGVAATTTSGFAVVKVVNSSFFGNLSTGGGVAANTNGAIAVTNSTFDNLATGAQAGTNAILDIDNSLFSTTGVGITAVAGTFSPVNVSNNSFYNATTAFGGAGTYSSANNNRIGSGTSQGATPSAMLIK